MSLTASEVKCRFKDLLVLHNVYVAWLAVDRDEFIGEFSVGPIPGPTTTDVKAIEQLRERLILADTEQLTNRTISDDTFHDHPVLPAEFPAAHSADTCWFAVDADGHVGFFETGESGNFPTTNLSLDDIRKNLLEHGFVNVLSEWGDQWPYDLAEFVFNKLNQMGVETGTIIDVPVWLHPYVGDYSCHITDVGNLSHIRWRSFGKVLAFVASRGAVSTELDRGECHLVPQISDSPVAVLFSNMPRVTAERLIRARQLLSINDREFPGHSFESDPVRPGIYSYGFRDFSGPYTRNTLPGAPVRITDLPTVVQKIVGGIRLDNVRFREARFLEPGRYVPCNWSPERSPIREDGSIDPDFDLSHIEEERNDDLDEMNEFPNYETYHPWALQLIERIEEFREANVPHGGRGRRATGQSVNVALVFDSETAAESAQNAFADENMAGSSSSLAHQKRIRLRLVCRNDKTLNVKDHGIVDSPGQQVVNADYFYNWIGQQLRTGLFSEPQVEISTIG